MPLLETTRTPDLKRKDASIVRAESLHKSYGSGKKQVHALNDASFALKAGETLGVVGESGSGKSTLAKALIRLAEPTSGAIYINERDFLALKDSALDEARKQIQMIFQDPYGSLNPTHSVGWMITRAMELGGNNTGARRPRQWNCWSWSALRAKPISVAQGTFPEVSVSA